MKVPGVRDKSTAKTKSAQAGRRRSFQRSKKRWPEFVSFLSSMPTRA
jgi:hypothetical protein